MQVCSVRYMTGSARRAALPSHRSLGLEKNEKKAIEYYAGRRKRWKLLCRFQAPHSVRD